MEFRLYAVRVFTRDWERARDFYRDTVGFPLLFDDADMGWAQFQLGGASLGVERCDGDDAETLTADAALLGPR